LVAGGLTVRGTSGKGDQMVYSRAKIAAEQQCRARLPRDFLQLIADKNIKSNLD
jgi:hypothetical protein